ncbi:hypothetical protein M433DRAFT_156202 [Acidomyces richmondensis BFW]|nr:MAG: hypothetical protein FE78DRAFT_92888 [Acidomyces sp. 'richmondensis']KYG43897.1 hypothetical protein M433DRAFT_156202 [Acidomyces richmondensis BFW]
MDAILAAHNALEQKSNLSKALADVNALLATLQTTRDTIAAEDNASAALHISKLKQPLKTSFDRIEEDLKEINKGLNQYQKALRDKFKGAAFPTAGLGGGASGDGLEGKGGLVDRAIAMHLLREGKFSVAKIFVREVEDGQKRRRGMTKEREGRGEGKKMDGGEKEREEGEVVDGEDDESASQMAWIRDFQTDDPPPPTPKSSLPCFGVDDSIMSDADDAGGEDLNGLLPDRPTTTTLGKGYLQQKFAEMYHILDALRNSHNLQPAIDWARQHSAELETRGSNLEFELARLRFIELYTSLGPLAALSYARVVFPDFAGRHTAAATPLFGALAFAPALSSSPYGPFFLHPPTAAYAAVCTAFTREFCTLLSLPPASPLHTAVTAGAIALPTLQKLHSILTATRGQWTSANELPVETPLPPGFMFHSVFVCPVSKEQATDANPPMMLPCGHVIARESLEGHARGKARMKCPYCPIECRPADAKQLYI